MVNKIDSNLTSFAFAEETSPKVLPVSPIWYGLDINSYSDFGGNVTKIGREPINGSRQRLRGSVSYVAANAGFNVDLTKNSISRLLQGFFYANVIEQLNTNPSNSTQTLITAVAAGTGVYSAASGLGSFVANQLVLCSGFSNAANNGVFKVTSATPTTLTTSNSNSVVEASPPSNASIEVVGFEFAAGALALTVSAAAITLTASSNGTVLQGLPVGCWVFIGGDALGNRFTNGGSGFARVLSTTATSATFDKTTWTPVADTGTGKNIRLWFSSFNKNASSVSGINIRSYQLERQLGNDGDGITSQVSVGAFPNELSLSIKMKEKISADLTFVCIDEELRTGVMGVKAGTRINLSSNDAAYNASNDVYRIAIAPYSTSVLNSPALVGYVTDAKISINNNVNPADAIGENTAFDIFLGNFDISGEIEAYFTSTAAISSIRNNTDVTFDIIISSPNGDGTYHGKVFDIPMLDTGNGKLNVAKDQPIKLPISLNGAKCTAGYSASVSEFKSLPALAAPT